jgi:ABC-type sugar transport system ATPase subunit
MAKRPRAEIAACVAETAAWLRIDSLLDRRPRQLSGGQQQRVALGRAMVRRPKVFLLDEPLSNLDAALRLAMRAELRRLHREIGATFVFVTHDQTEAMSLSDSIAVLSAGRLLQVGRPLDVYREPGDTFVARFIGSPPMNLLPGRFAPGARGDGLLAGVRPHDVRLVEAGRRATVTAVEALGSEWHVVAECEGEPVVAVLPSEARPPAAGSEAGIEVAAGAWHLFDAASGRRVGPAG